MEFGIFSIGDVLPDAHTGRPPSDNERIQGLAKLAQRAEQAGFDVFALGEHHNPPYVTSADTTLLAYIAAMTDRLVLSTATTLITTNDPVKIAEDFATLQHLSQGRVDLILGRGNTPAVFPWFGQDPRNGLELTTENYGLLRRLWREENVDWQGHFRTPLQNFTAVPRPLDGKPPFVWHASVSTPQIAELAAYCGDGFFVNNLFMPMSHFQRLTDLYRERFEVHGHGRPADAIVGAGGQVFVQPKSQDAIEQYRPYFHNTPVYRGQNSLEDVMAATALSVGSPQQIIDKTLSFRDYYGSYQRQLFSIDLGGVPLDLALQQLDLLGEHVLPTLRQETDPVPV